MIDAQLDRIFIKDLLLRMTIGCNEEERATKTDVLINIVMWSKTQKALETENLNDTVDYSIIYSRLITLAESHQFVLIETLAEKIANIALEHPLVQKVQITVEKPAIYKYLKSAGIDIVRQK